jgi:hypothetical protein
MTHIVQHEFRGSGYSEPHRPGPARRLVRRYQLVELGATIGVILLFWGLFSL